MMEPTLTRRAMLMGLCAGTLEALQHAHQQVRGGGRDFSYLEPRVAAELEALASAIIPSDETAGAREAGVIFFIDKALSTFDQDKRELYREGLEATRRKRRELFPQATSIASLTGTQCNELVQSIEATAFFEQLRTHTLIGFLATPEWGGNRGEAGWKLIGFEDAGSYQPPFGYYDRESDAK